jgi:preprotein translocase subunit SecG
MDPDRIKKLIKRSAFAASFFALALVFFALRLRGVLVAYVCAVAVLMVGAILLQRGRGSGLASLGGMSGDTLLGMHSATPIAKATYVMAALFLFICILLAKLPRAESGPALTEPAAPAAPTTPAPPPGGGQPSPPPVQEPPAESP